MIRPDDTASDKPPDTGSGSTAFAQQSVPDTSSSEGRSELLRREFLDGMFVLAAILTPDGVMLEANESALTAFGLTRKDVLGATFQQVAQRVLTAQATTQAAQLLRRAAAGQRARADLTAHFAGGQTAVLDCTFRPLRDGSGKVVQIAATGVDVTAHKQAELALKKLNRELRLLSDCNQLLIRARDEQSLLDAICNVIVEGGGYRLAWVGFAVDDAEKSVRPVAIAGLDADYVRHSRMSWGDSAWGQGPTGRAIRNQTAEICRDIGTDPVFAPWRADAQARGYASSIAVPLGTSGARIGALNIYSDDSAAFDSSEVRLLTELADDLAYGVETLGTRAERTFAQEKMALFSTLLQHAQDMIYVADARTGRILDVNESGARSLEYTREELLQLTVSDFSVLAAQEPWHLRAEGIKAVGTMVVENLYRTKSGRTFPVEFSLRYIEHGGTAYITGVSRDITERWRQREQIERLARILRMQSGINSAVLRIRDQDELLQEACRLATEVGGYDRAVFSVVDASGKFAIPRFRSGNATDFPEPPQLPLPIGDDSGPDSNLSARALRTGQIAVNSDLTCADPPVAMREELVRLGYKAMAALPLIVEGRPVGALVLTARDADLLADTELLILLQDMMSSLSFALRSKENAETAQYLTYFDPLTGLAKRSLFLERLTGLLPGERGPSNEVTVIAIDIRGVNRINDTYGRHFGDIVLLRIADRLKGYARSDLHIGHFGGDSFALVEPPLITGDASLRSMLNANLFGEPFEIEGQSLHLSCSYGVAHYPRDATEAGALVQQAEAALKQAKERGEQYLHYRLDMHSQMAAHLALEHALSAAVAANQFELYYQPQLSMQTGRVEAVEALLRWNHPEDGVVAPGRFLAVLESTGLILSVGDWALNRAVEDCERWFRMGLPPMRIAVNVSAVQVRQSSFVANVLRHFQRLQACTGFGLDLEITESMLLQDLEGTSRKLRELRTAGVRIALDDFGTGYSALGLLPKLPVDLLKIDKSFVGGLPDNAASVVLVDTVLRLASAFELITVVEGIETAPQLQAVRAMRCDLWQGYLHSKPMPTSALEQRLITA
jgi:diguanylate cyclase (GGDEF)-like protein/PAS domain S-box-containing protein